jgi:ankyrin repeat protein
MNEKNEYIIDTTLDDYFTRSNSKCKYLIMHSLLTSLLESDFESFCVLLNDNKEFINNSDVNGCTLLHFCVKNSKIKETKLLFHYGVDVFCYDNFGYSPIHYITLIKDKIKINNMLNIFNKNINYKTTNGNTLLHLAVCDENYYLINEIIKRNGNMNIKNHNDMKPIDYNSNNNTITCLLND